MFERSVTLKIGTPYAEKSFSSTHHIRSFALVLHGNDKSWLES